VKTAFIVLIIPLLICCNSKKGEYACPPCNAPCDELAFTNAGTCPHCNMRLVKHGELNKEESLTINQIEIHEGSGAFAIRGGKGKEDKSIKVYYHKPKNFKPDSRILLVIPGDGRNGDSYRDAWITESEKHSVLILSPMYAEDDYAFEDYHLCGLMTDLNIKSATRKIEGTNMVELDESKFTYQVTHNQDEWIFKDFDRIFDLAVRATNSKQMKYDVFGHSAGGQILHRFALFYPQSKADKILASNSGFYTAPDFSIALPFGVKNTRLNLESLRLSFEKNLVLFIGELDNQNETGGTLLRSTTADKQGLSRVERATYFYNKAKAVANENKLKFNWTLKLVPGVGHNHEKIGNEAAKLLYEHERQ
jgi:DNA-directed RNA polymerase subunit RPC12/RpoP